MLASAIITRMMCKTLGDFESLVRSLFHFLCAGYLYARARARTHARVQYTSDGTSFASAAETACVLMSRSNSSWARSSAIADGVSDAHVQACRRSFWTRLDEGLPKCRG